MMLTHQEASELLAVYALDAVDEDEHALLELHLAACPRCRAELDDHREVAAALGNSVEPLPEGLWSSISRHVLLRTDEERAPIPVLLRAVPETGKSRGKGRMLSLAAVAIAAAAAAAVLGINLVSANNQVAHLQGALGETARTAVVAALETPGHKVVDLDSATHHQLAELVVLRGGQGYLAGSNLPTLSSKKTYQLWGVIDGQTISLGLLGATPHLAAFTLASTPRPSALGITAEPAGGSVLPTESMLAAGPV
jgi:hypothetical protein